MGKQQVPLWVRGTAFVREHLSFITLAVLFVWSLFGWPSPDTATGATKTIINLLDLAVPLAVIWLVVTAFMRTASFHYLRYLGGVLYDIVLLIVTFQLACRFLVQIQGVINDIIDGAIESPELAISTVVSVYLVIFMCRLCIGKSKVQSMSVAYGRPTAPIHRTEASLKLTAVHECGHALVYALQNTHPEIMRMGLTQESRGNELRLGYMESNVALDGRATRDQLYWRMLLALGGSAAELAVYGKQYEGALEDMRTWQEQAGRYLQNGFGQVLMCDDGHDDSLRHNIAAFNALHAEQVTIVNRFMRDNVTLLTEMATELRHLGALDKQAITSFLGRVSISVDVPTFVIAG
ncbi:hypothetical protein [Providencia alcalifaciens]|uniref:hypothetical protein n=1 Tax=Providencia alcalifaciens TaxID=126385 RepID=UPI002AA0D806|nr:hypothetical protein [Providencia alcalifaciens]